MNFSWSKSPAFNITSNLSYLHPPFPSPLDSLDTPKIGLGESLGCISPSVRISVFSDLRREEGMSQRRDSVCQSTGLVFLSIHPCNWRIYTGDKNIILAQNWCEKKFKLNICSPFCSAGPVRRSNLCPASAELDECTP